jgi:hypothetical protein
VQTSADAAVALGAVVVVDSELAKAGTAPTPPSSSNQVPAKVAIRRVR